MPRCKQKPGKEGRYLFFFFFFFKPPQLRFRWEFVPGREKVGYISFLCPDTAIQDVLILVNFVLRLFETSAFSCLALLWKLVSQWRLHRQCQARLLRLLLDQIRLTHRESGDIPVWMRSLHGRMPQYLVKIICGCFYGMG